MFNLYDYFAGITGAAKNVSATNVTVTPVAENPDDCRANPFVPNDICVNDNVRQQAGIRTNATGNTAVSVCQPGYNLTNNGTHAICVPTSNDSGLLTYVLGGLAALLGAGTLGYYGKKKYDAYKAAKPEDNLKLMADRGFTQAQIDLIKANKDAMAFILLATEVKEAASTKAILALANEDTEGFKHLAETYGASEELVLAYMGEEENPTADDVKVKIIADAVKKEDKKDDTADKLAADKLAADKLAADKLAADKLAADKLAADKLAADKLASDKLASEKAAKEAADKAAAAAPKPAVVPTPVRRIV